MLAGISDMEPVSGSSCVPDDERHLGDTLWLLARAVKREGRACEKCVRVH
jgi:hypothetical protein